MTRAPQIQAKSHIKTIIGPTHEARVYDGRAGYVVWLRNHDTGTVRPRVRPFLKVEDALAYARTMVSA
jgi:hypothetical protein